MLMLEPHNDPVHFDSLEAVDRDVESVYLQKIEAYAQTSETLPELGIEALDKVQETRNHFLKAKESILKEIVAVEQKSHQLVSLRTKVARHLSELTKKSSLSQDDFADIEHILIDYQGAGCPERQKEMIARALVFIHRRLSTSLVKEIAKLTQDLTDIEQLWRDVVLTCEIPQELIEDMDRLMFGMSIRNALLSLKKYEKKLDAKSLACVRAKTFSDLLQNGFSAEIVLDLIEGRYDENDPYWFGNIVQEFFEFNEHLHEKIKRGFPFIGKLIVSGTTAALIAGMMFSPVGRGEKTPQEEATTSETYQDENPESSEDVIELTVQGGGGGGSTGEGGDAGEGTGGEGSGTNGSSPEGEGSSPSEDGNAQPTEMPPAEENVFPENSEGLDHTEYWEIEGTIPETYFRTNSSEQFEYQGWKFSREMLMPFNVNTTKLESETIITSKIGIQRAGFTAIPVPIGWEVSFVTIGGGWPPGGAQVFRTPSGGYLIELYADLGNLAIVQVGLDRQQSFDPTNYYNQTPRPEYTNRASIDTGYLMRNIEAIPQETLNYLNEIKNSHVSSGEKAKQVTNFVKDHFIYSLDSAYSNYYKENGITEYVSRAWEVGYGDCDVVNTTNIAFLRYVGLDARMSIGFANGQSLLDKSSKALEGAEMHGWAEYFDTERQQWLVADATPTTTDEDAAGQIMEWNNGTGIENIFAPTDLEGLKKEFALLLSKLGDIQESGVGPALEALALILGYFTAFFAALRGEKKNQELIEDFERKISNLDSISGLGNALNYEVNKIITKYIKEKLYPEGNILLKLRSVIRAILVAPVVVQNIRDRKQDLAPIIESRAVDDNQLLPQFNEETYASYLQRVAGVEVDTSHELARESLRKNIRDMRSAIYDELQVKLQKITGAIIYPSIFLNLSEEFHELREKNETGFLEAVTDTIYQYCESRSKKKDKGNKPRKPFTLSKVELIEELTPFLRNAVAYYRLEVEYRNLSRTENKNQ